MEILHFDSKLIRQFTEDFHRYPHPGALVTGASQTAKTASWLTCLEEDMLRRRKGIVFLPHGDPRLTSFAASSALDVRKHVVPLCPADGRNLGINALHWLSETEIPSIAEQLRQITRYVYGDQDTETASPNIDHFLELAIEVVTRLRYPVTLAADAINPFAGDRYKVMRDRAIEHSQGELLTDFVELEAMDVRDWSAIVRPAHKRLMDVFRKNPFVRDLMSTSESVDPRWLFDKFTIVDLKSNPTGSDRPVLRKKDRILLACLYAVAILNARMNGDVGGYREDFTITFDELTIFRPLRIPIEIGLREAAKFQLKQVGIQQNFEPDNPLIQTFLGNAAYHMNFRASSQLDQDAFAVLPHRMTFDPRRVKHVLSDREQFQAGHQIVSLISQTDGWSSGNDGGHSSGSADQFGKTQDEAGTQTTGTSESDTDQESHGTSKSRHDNVQLFPLGEDRPSMGQADGENDSNSKSKTSGHTEQSAHTVRHGNSRNRGWNQSESQSWSNQRSGSVTIGRSIVPVHQWRDVVRAIQFLSESEQLSIWYRIFAMMAVGQCVLTIVGVGPRIVQFPIPYEISKSRPRFARRQLNDYLTSVNESGIFLPYDKIKTCYRDLVSSMTKTKKNDVLGIEDSKPNRNIGI